MCLTGAWRPGLGGSLWPWRRGVAQQVAPGGRGGPTLPTEALRYSGRPDSYDCYLPATTYSPRLPARCKVSAGQDNWVCACRARLLFGSSRGGGPAALLDPIRSAADAHPLSRCREWAIGATPLPAPCSSTAAARTRQTEAHSQWPDGVTEVIGLLATPENRMDRRPNVKLGEAGAPSPARSNGPFHFGVPVGHFPTRASRHLQGPLESPCSGPGMGGGGPRPLQLFLSCRDGGGRARAGGT